MECNHTVKEEIVGTNDVKQTIGTAQSKDAQTGLEKPEPQAVPPLLRLNFATLFLHVSRGSNQFSVFSVQKY